MRSTLSARHFGSIKGLTALVLGTLVLSGCASFSPDGGFDTVRETTRARIGADAQWARSDEARKEIDTRVAELLAKPLAAEDAVQVAIYNNRGLRAAFYDLGISEAEMVQAGRLPNPHFSMLRTRRAENGVREFKIEQVLTFNLFALITMPLAVEVEKRNFAQTQRMTALEVARLASETRKAYFGAIAAEESVRYPRKVKQAAEAGAGLARKMAEVGNFNRLQQAREQGFYASAALDLARAEQASIAARERLTKLLGLPSPQAIRLPERLPDLPKLPDELPAVEQTALDQRLDLQAVRLETEALAKNLGLTQATRFINVLEFGPARVLEGARDSGYKRGYEVSFELPIFDFGGSKVAKAEAIYGQAVERAAEAAINARSEVREAYSAYRNSFDIAKHYRDEIVPLNKRIAEENLLRYNGMLIGVFDLLADARSQITSVNSYIESLRDYWTAASVSPVAMAALPELIFNLWTFNSRAFPGIDSLNVRQNDRVRIRVGNLTMTNHPIHLHGHEFTVTGTDGGPTPKGSRWPEVTTDIAVGQMRQVEFIANEAGDWAFHCHKSHHTMNAMGHDVPTMIGVDHREAAKQITDLIPDYMVMGERGMADMGEMEMPLPDNTLPMMTGQGPYGAVEMGGMFTVLKVRAEQKAGDYADPGWYKQPPGTRAYEWTGPAAEPPRAKTQGGQSMPATGKPAATDVQVRKPGPHSGH